MNFKKINFLIIVFIFNITSSLISSNDDNSVAAVAAGAAIGAAAGYGFCQLFSNFSCSSDQLVEDACKELMKSKQYSKQMEIIDKEFKGLSSIDKKEALFETNEDLAEQIASTSPKKIVDHDYCRDLKSNIKNLKFYQDKFPKRIRKLQKIRNQQKFLPIINDMQELIRRIDVLLPKLDILNQYIMNHSRYFELDEFMNFISNFYNQELKIFASKKILIEELKRIARAKNRLSTYPLIDYAEALNRDIQKFNKYIPRASLKYDCLIEDANKLKRKIIKLKDLIVTDREYFSEQRSLENARAQDAGMFLLGAAAGAITGAALSSTKSEPKVIKQKNSYVIENPDEYVIIED